MGIYQGRVNNRKLADTLHDAMTKEGYKEISSSHEHDGRVYFTEGADGNNPFYVKIHDPKSNFLTTGVYDLYTPYETYGFSGTFGNGQEGGIIRWNTSVSNDLIEVDYVFNITKDRIIVFVEGLKAQSYSICSLSYIGLPTRYSKEDTGGKFAGIAYTSNGPSNNHYEWKALRDRSNVILGTYTMDYYYTSQSRGWGNRLFFSPILLGNSAEGTRGELNGLYRLPNISADYDIQHRDIFRQDNKQYMVIYPTAYGHDTLYNVDKYVIEI